MSKTKKSLLKKAKHLKRNIEDLHLPKKEKLKAVAIKYEVGKKTAPQIIAAGKGVIAERILSVAEENSIPFFEDPTLTELLAKLEIDMEIPPELYSLVAEVLAFTYQLNKEMKNKKRSRK